MKNTIWPQRSGRYLVVSLLVVAFAFAGYAAFAGFGGRLTEVVIEIDPTAEGLFLIQNHDIERRLDDSPFGVLAGQSLKRVDVEALEAYLTADPFVRRAQVYVRFDGTLHVDIEQHEPILRVHDRRGADYYVSPEGAIVPLSKHAVARVPVLTGEVPSLERAVRDTMPIAAYPLAKRISEDELLRALVEQIEVKDGEYTLVPKLGSAEFLLGKPVDLDAKLHRLEAFIKGVYPESGWDHYERVDLRYDGLAFAKQAPDRA